MESSDLDLLEADDFEKNLNQSFDIRFKADQPIRCRLIEVTRLTHFSPASRKPFSIVFQIPPEYPVYPQGVYRVQRTNDEKTMDLFLVPIGADKMGIRYEAVFS